MKAFQERNGQLMDQWGAADYDRYARENFGVSWQQADFLAGIGARLSRGESITSADTKKIASIYPHLDPKQVASIAKQVNDLPPGPNRLSGYVQHLAGSQSGPDVDGLHKLISDYATAEISEGILAKREVDVPKDINGRPIPTVRPKEDPMSVREHLRRGFNLDHADNVRRMSAEFPEVEQIVRERAADRMDRAFETLERDDISTRDAVAAAYTVEETKSAAIDEGWLPDDMESA